MILCSKEGNFLAYFWYVRKPCSVSVKSNGDLIVCDSADAEVKILSHDGCHKLDSFAGDPVLDGAPSFAIHHQDRFRQVKTVISSMILARPGKLTNS